ncbi:MAG TPA: thymidylate synthase, partial [Candidatus Saccharimonadales bacterium]|nr:thymidylate synthase [Candidatus Saccharimonadales bacterium]
WPILYENILRVGDPDQSVGVVTLWTERDVIKDSLEKKDYAAIGNLYSPAGINHMMRNVLANPSIRHLIMWGADMSGSGSSLRNFFEKGIDGDYKIVDAPGQIEPEIPREAVESFRSSVNLIDMRGKPKEEVVKAVKKFKKEKPFREKAEIFPASEKKVTTWPSEQTSFRIESPKIASLWLKVLNMVTKYGRVKSTRYATTNELKELLNLNAVVYEEDPENEYFPEYLPFTTQELKAYYPEWLTARRIPGMAYNYGDRMRNMDGINQIEEIKKLLAARPDSKKMIASLYNVKVDWAAANTGDTPCITQIIGGVQDKKFFMTVHVRSQDMFHGWPRNMFAARKLQKEIADAGGYPLGKLAMITHSAHMYADDWATAQELLDKYYVKETAQYKPGFHFQEDPRGNWLVDIDWENKLILAKLMSPDMATELTMFHGKTAKEVIKQIGEWEILTLPSHALDFGAELQKAEIALNNDLRDWKQDRAINFERQKVEQSDPQEKIQAPTRYVKRGKKSIPIK